MVSRSRWEYSLSLLYAWKKEISLKQYIKYWWQRYLEFILFPWPKKKLDDSVKGTLWQRRTIKFVYLLWGSKNLKREKWEYPLPKTKNNDKKLVLFQHKQTFELNLAFIFGKWGWNFTVAFICNNVCFVRLFRRCFKFYRKCTVSKDFRN